MKTNGMVSLSLLLGGAGLAACLLARAESTPMDFALSEADRQAVFKAAGAVQRKGMWVICADDPNVSGAAIESVRDLNGDRRPEALVTEGGTFCYGDAGTGF